MPPLAVASGPVQGLRSLQKSDRTCPQPTLPGFLAPSPPPPPTAHHRPVPPTAHSLGLLPAGSEQPRPGRAPRARSQRQQTDPCPVERGLGELGSPQGSRDATCPGTVGHRPAGSCAGSGEVLQVAGTVSVRVPRDGWASSAGARGQPGTQAEAPASGSFPTGAGRVGDRAGTGRGQGPGAQTGKGGQEEGAGLCQPPGGLTSGGQRCPQALRDAAPGRSLSPCWASGLSPWPLGLSLPPRRGWPWLAGRGDTQPPPAPCRSGSRLAGGAPARSPRGSRGPCASLGPAVPRSRCRSDVPAAPARPCLPGGVQGSGEEPAGVAGPPRLPFPQGHREQM